jgi:arsenate reductase
MGCDVICSVISDVKIVRWEIPDPKGKSIEEYQRTIEIIKEKVKELLKKEL